MAGYVGGMIHIAHAEFEDAGHVADSGKILRGGHRGECPIGVVIVEAGIEYACHAETLRTRHHAVGSQAAFGAGQRDVIACVEVEFLRHQFAYYDGIEAVGIGDKIGCAGDDASQGVVGAAF